MSEINIFLKGFFKFLQVVFKPLILFGFKTFYRKIDKKKPLSQCDQILLTPAHILAKKIRSREITSEKLVRLFINRIKEIQPILNCVVEERFDQAIEEAIQADKFVSIHQADDKYLEINAPFLGVPFSCKESIAVKGMSNNSGFVSRKKIKALEDSTVIKFMKKAGCILTCVTNTSECCMWIESTNFTTGTTRNPYNLSRIVGGSSGGEGCIISACGSIWGIGSDIGGSIRIPSLFNGIYGHKPSIELIPNEFQFPNFIGMQTSMLSIGPMCRYASDLKHLLTILCGSNNKKFLENFTSNFDLKKLKYYYIQDLNGNPWVSRPSNDCRKTLFNAVRFIENDLAIEVKEIKLKNLKSCFQIWTSIMSNGLENYEWYKSFLGKELSNPFLEFVKSIFGLQKKHTFPLICLVMTGLMKGSNVEYHLSQAQQLKKEVQEILGNDGVLIFPSFPDEIPYHNQTILTNSFDFLYFACLNIFGFPVTQIPMGLNSSGLPTGVQLMANENMDHYTITLAEHFESNFVGWIPPF